MKGDTKCEKWGWFDVVTGHWESPEIAPFYRAHTNFYISLA